MSISRIFKAFAMPLGILGIWLTFVACTLGPAGVAGYLSSKLGGMLVVSLSGGPEAILFIRFLFAMVGLALTFLIFAYLSMDIYNSACEFVIFWGKLHGPLLVKCENNGTWGIARISFWTAKKYFHDCITVPRLPKFGNVMTFSDRRPVSEVTGSLADMNKVTEGCKIFSFRFLVPSTSRDTAGMTHLLLDEAYRLVGKRK